MIYVKVEKLKMMQNKLGVEVSLHGIEYSEMVYSPKMAIYFSHDEYSRRIPLIVRKYEKGDNDQAVIEASQMYEMDCLFEYGKIVTNFQMTFAYQYGSLENEQAFVNIKSGEFSSNLEVQISGVDENSDCMDVAWNRKLPVEQEIKKKCLEETEQERKVSVPQKEAFLSKVNRHLFKAMFRFFYRFSVRNNRLFILSNRRNTMSGNLDFVYKKLPKEELEIPILTKNCDMDEFHPFYFFKAAYYAATSHAIMVDDSCNFLDFIDLKPDTKYIQLWHGCGAFKTFGYSRLGKAEGPNQRNRNHRFYTHTITSAKEVVKFYSEAFGMAMKDVYPTGVPRTDVFFDEEYKKKIRKKFYEEYPFFKGKKVVLFAPTFRGADKETAHYPKEKFDAIHFLEEAGDDYVMIIKYHPYIKERYLVPKEYEHRILELTDKAEINDLLFVTDLLITDYSCVDFEAGLLRIPMIFYAFDLKDYIRDRDFYYEYLDFVPGAVVYTQEQLEEVFRRKEYHEERLDAFMKKSFDHYDGKSSQRVADMVMKAMRE